MALAILLLAAIPAYLLAGVAWFLGAGWVVTLLVLAGSGTGFAIGVAFCLCRRGSARPPQGKAASCHAPGGTAPGADQGLGAAAAPSSAASAARASSTCGRSAPAASSNPCSR